MTIAPQNLLNAAHKGAAWLAAHQTEQGNYIGKEQPDAEGTYPDADDLGCYYKSFYSMRVAGESVAAARGLKYLAKRFMTPDGDFVNSPTERTKGSYTPLFSQLYPNTWIIRAFVQMGWWDYAAKAFDCLLKYRDPEIGGLYATVTPPTKVIDSNVTGIGGILCSMLLGRLDLAIQSGELLLRMIAEQPDPRKMYMRYEAGKGLLTDLTGVDPKAYLYHYLDAEQPKQAYWPWAMPMADLALLYARTGEKRFLDGALQVYEFLSRCHPHAFSWTTSGKSGWGAGILYRLTGDPKCKAHALQEMEFLLSLQQENGAMLGPGGESIEAQATRTTYDLTGEYTAWLTDTAAELMMKG